MPSTSDIFALIPVTFLALSPVISCVNDFSSMEKITSVIGTDFNFQLFISAIFAGCCSFICWKMLCSRERSIIRTKCVSSGQKRVEKEDKQLLAEPVKDATVPETGNNTLFSSENDLLKSSTSDTEVKDMDISTIGYTTKDGTEGKEHAVKDSNEPKCEENDITNSIGFRSTEKVGRAGLQNSTGISEDDGITENKLVELEPVTQPVSDVSVFKHYLIIQEELFDLVSSLNAILDEELSCSRNSLDKMEGKTCINNSEYKFCEKMVISKNIALEETKESRKNLKEFFDLDSSDIEINEALTNACEEIISDIAVCKGHSTPLNEITGMVSSVKKIIEVFLSNVAACTAKGKEMHSRELKNIATQENVSNSQYGVSMEQTEKLKTDECMFKETSLKCLLRIPEEYQSPTELLDSCIAGSSFNECSHSDPTELQSLFDSGIFKNLIKEQSENIGEKVLEFYSEKPADEAAPLVTTKPAFQTKTTNANKILNETIISEIPSLNKCDDDLYARPLQETAEIESNIHKDVNEDVSKEANSSLSEQSQAEVANDRRETPATVLPNISHLTDVRINQTIATDMKSAEKSSEGFSDLHDLKQLEITTKNNESMHRTNIGGNESNFELSDHECDVGVVNKIGFTFLGSIPDSEILSLSDCDLSTRALQGNAEIESNIPKDVNDDVSKEPHSSLSEQSLEEVANDRRETPAVVLPNISHLTDVRINQTIATDMKSAEKSSEGFSDLHDLCINYQQETSSDLKQSEITTINNESMQSTGIGENGSDFQRWDLGVVNKIDLTFIYSISDMNKHPLF